MEGKPTVLVVDDELFNIELITDFLNEEPLELVCVNSGEKAMKLLQETPTRFHAVLLDRMMPGMNGMEVLSSIKSSDQLNRLPVIMQTARNSKEDMLEGLSAGAHYYLSKPYNQDTLVTIVSTAVRDYCNYLNIQDELNQTTHSMKMICNGKFRFRTLTEARNLAALLANACPDPETVLLGLGELLINAVEHGNLCISYEEKTRLNTEGRWENEVEHRLELPEYKDRYATIELNRTDNKIAFIITDKGDGFDWHQYMEICPERAFDSHGRGIAMANSISFSEVEYMGKGNQVRVTVL